MNTRKITVLAALAVATTTFGTGRRRGGICPVLGAWPSTTVPIRCALRHRRSATRTTPAPTRRSRSPAASRGACTSRSTRSRTSAHQATYNLEQGREVFVGSLNGGATGLFTTTYKFESKWDPDISTGPEVKGRCQHQIVAGSGTGGFAGATGRVDVKDVISDGSLLYHGHIQL